MIALPPYIFLIVFGLFLAVFLFLATTNIVLLARFGARNAIGFTVSFLFISAVAIVLFMTWQSLAGIDWMTPVPLFSIPTGAF